MRRYMVEILADFFVSTVFFGLTKSAYPPCQTEGTVSNAKFETVPFLLLISRAFADQITPPVM